ncbi:TetR family transcriptional regulator [Tamaricihabitans halophyticus]|uniref:TetR family transcriptional regulator n=1 Tax=Tamaricihabitans halophyticus TaxID=1262583 RepID=A0A4R2QI78_9PSEU|nr:TetR/AcrR family transcriptional regulator [Tamaricihabitans halophyticus]TCP48479.1 TetR family transcriptional regulator [Tamaricihabitans halophyticus]
MTTRSTSRRDRLRQATLADIHAAARKLLTTGGSAAVTINAVAREVGMSGPALYHYFTGHDELVGAVTTEFFRELSEAMEGARDAQPAGDVDRRLLATCRGMRAWAIAHPAEFGWIFASPAQLRDCPDATRLAAVHRFEQIFLDQVVVLWQQRPFEVPELDELAPSMRAQLTDYVTTIESRLPPAAAHVYLTCWIRLYGLLCMEVLHQLDFAYADAEPVFEECLRELSGMLGLTYQD